MSAPIRLIELYAAITPLLWRKVKGGPVICRAITSHGLFFAVQKEADGYFLIDSGTRPIGPFGTEKEAKNCAFAVILRHIIPMLHVVDEDGNRITSDDIALDKGKPF